MPNYPNKLFSCLAFVVQTEDIMPAGSILQFDKALLIKIGIQWFNIILLTVVLVLVLYKPVKKYMSDRAERIKSDIHSARLNNENALELKRKYEKLIDNVEKEREEILSQAHRMAMERSDQILLSARQEAKHMLKKAEDEIEVERENAAEDIKRQIIELSTLMASRFVEVSIDRQTQDRYIEEALADWGEQA